MTPKQALKDIIKKNKWYTVIYTNDKGELVRDTKKETSLRVTALRILNGTAHHLAIKNFFEHFGMEVELIVKTK